VEGEDSLAGVVRYLQLRSYYVRNLELFANEFLVSGRVGDTVLVACAAAKYTHGIMMRMATERWTFGDGYIIPVETNEKEAMSTCRFHAHGGILSQRAKPQKPKPRRHSFVAR
jgi:hypothetical protein